MKEVIEKSMKTTWYYEVNFGEITGIVFAESEEEAKKKVLEVYKDFEPFCSKAIVEVFPIEEHKGYDEEHPEVIQLFG